MRIANYDKQNHDVYTFNESLLRLISWGYNGTNFILPPSPEEYSSYIDPITGNLVQLENCSASLPAEFIFRRKAPVTGFNSSAATFIQNKGLDVPDWSGIHVRDRGSGTNRCLDPHVNFALGTELYNQTPPYEKVFDTNYWNSGDPPFYLISDRHFLACRHFIGPTNTSNKTIRLLKKSNGQPAFFTGQYVGFSGDLNLYRLQEALTPAQQAEHKIYEIVDPYTVPLGTKVWRITPNGSYVLYQTTTLPGILPTTPGSLSTNNLLVPPQLTPYSQVDPDFPEPAPNGIIGRLVWAGDSGSPLLITANGETYFYSADAGGGPPGEDVVWGWLQPKLQADGVVKTRIDLGHPRPTTTTFGLEVVGDTYKSGFLEEAEANGRPFIKKYPYGNPPIVDFLISGDIPQGRITLHNVKVEGGLLICDVRINDLLVVPSSSFPINEPPPAVAPYILAGQYKYSSFAASNGQVFVSYTIRADALDLTYEPIDVFELLPSCVDSHVGQVSIINQNQVLPSGDLQFLPGYNYNLDYDIEEAPVSCLFSVAPGAGEGLEPCPADVQFEDVLRTFNGVTPGEQGNIEIQPNSADCISVDGYYEGQAGIVKLDSHCAPCCRCSDYVDTSDYIKGVALQYHQAVAKLNELTLQYNSIAAQVKDRITECASANRLYARLKIWPQQGFKIQVQAMAENNTRKNVRIKKLKLKLVLSIPNDTGVGISAVDPDTGVTYSMGPGQAIAVAPLSDASYLYFKNLNPVSKGFDFRAPNPGVVEFETDLTNNASALPPAPEGGSPYDVEPCTGYAMITGGVNIVDPVFRKIVNIAYKDGLTINVRIYFKYIGTPAGQDPCLDEEDGEHNILVPEFELREIVAKGNRSSATPCDSARASSVSFNPDTGGVSLRFPNELYGEGNVEISYRIQQDGQWVQYGDPVQLQITATGQSEFDIASVPGDLPSGTYQAVVRYLPDTTAAADAQLHTRCLAADAVADPVAIAASDFQVGTIFNVGGG